jgi:hypothetical protein
MVTKVVFNWYQNKLMKDIMTSNRFYSLSTSQFLNNQELPTFDKLDRTYTKLQE